MMESNSKDRHKIIQNKTDLALREFENNGIIQGGWMTLRLAQPLNASILKSQISDGAELEPLSC